MRATLAVEKAGFPAVTIVGSLFVTQANLVAGMYGLEDPPLAVYPGRIPMDDEETFREKIVSTIADEVVAGLTSGAPRLEHGGSTAEPRPRDIVVRGSLDEVNEHFHAQAWSDGLPIVPPTIERIEAFLGFTEREPVEVLGVLQPDSREATVWSVAVNGVMAGCRPEYMPLLIAVVEAVSDPGYRIVDSVSGSAWETIVTVSGPIIDQLRFNYGTGAQRVGPQANTSVGRFLNLYLRNVAGLRPGQVQKGGLGQTFFVALAEDEATVRELGWPTCGADDGLAPGESAVTLHGMFAGSTPLGEYEEGGSHDPFTYLRPLADFFVKGTASYWTHCGVNYGGFFPLVVLSQHAARVLAANGWTKDAIRQYLYDQSWVPARAVLARGLYVGMDDAILKERIEAGVVPADFRTSTDPDRLVPALVRPEWTRIMVAGNPEMYWQRGYISNHVHGKPTTRRIELPAAWEQLLAERGSG